MDERNTTEVLILGNGFDLAHELPSKYTDFLFFVRNIERIMGYLQVRREEISANVLGQKDSKIPSDYYRYMQKPDRIQDDEIERMGKMVDSNAWCHYYLNCNADIQGWIDFEREMIPVLDFFSWLLSSDYEIRDSTPIGVKCAYIEKVTPEKIRIANLLPHYVGVERSSLTDKIVVSSRFCDNNYGLFKARMIDDLKKQLDEFVEIFRIYLAQIVNNCPIEQDPIIKTLQADAILSFNYTTTEKNYPNLRRDNKQFMLPKITPVFHIHGEMQKENSMVLGVNEVLNDEDNHYIYFVKYFQRLRKRTDIRYRELLGRRFNVTIYGHSLDITDSDVLYEFIKNAHRVIVYYLDETDYEQKVINLINMLGRKDVERDMYNRRITFKQTKETE